MSQPARPSKSRPTSNEGTHARSIAYDVTMPRRGPMGGGGFALPDIDIDIDAGKAIDDVSTVDDVYGYGDLANQAHVFDHKPTKAISSFFDNEKISTAESGLGAALGGYNMFQ